MDTATMLSAIKGDKLKDSSQWRVWYKRVKAFAVQRSVWDLCNPEVEISHRPRALIEPIEPEYPQQGSQENKKDWRDLLEVYKIKANRWEKQRKGLNEVNELIIIYLDTSIRDAVLEYDTPYDRLVYLSQRFARSHAYKEEIRMKWRAFSIQKPIGDIEKWLISWDELREQAMTLELPEVQSANQDFLQAIKEVLPIWWQAKYEDIVMNRTIIDTRKLIESFRSIHREISTTMPTSPTLKGSFSTWQGHQEAKQEDVPFDKRPCPCGMKNHGPAKCYFLNEAVRPRSFTIPSGKLESIERTLAADPAWKKWTENIIQKAQTSTSIKVHQNLSFSSIGIPALTTSLRHRWILDTGSGVHVCNDRSSFVDLEACQEVLSTGDSSTDIIGRGTVRLTGIDPKTKKKQTITLSNACYAPGFHVNLVSYARLREKGGFWSEKKGFIEDSNGFPIVSLRLWKNVGLWVFDQEGSNQESYLMANAVRSSSTQRIKGASAELWHRRLGHPQYKTVQQMTKLVDGVNIDGNDKAQAICETCNLGRSNRQISRRPIGLAYNKHRWITHFYLDGIRFHWLMTHEYKPECQIAINQFVQLAKNWWNLPIRAFSYDNEAAAGRLAEQSLTSDGIVIYHSPPGHPEMNGYAERSGGVIIQRMRMLMLEGKLPKELWPEAAMAAIWLLNRTPTYLATENRWIIPWAEVVKQFTATGDIPPRINLSNVRLYGSLAYCRIDKQVQSDKMNPRAEIGFMVGYIASNIWRIWFPQYGKVKLVRDAIFDETRRYSPDFQQLQPVPLPLVKEPQELDQDQAAAAIQASIITGSVPDLEPRDNANDDNVHDSIQQGDRFSAEKPTPILQGVYTTPDRQTSDRQIDVISDVPGAFPREPPLPPTPASLATDQGVETAPAMIIPESENDQLQGSADSDEEAELQLQAGLLAPRNISGNIEEGNIISGPRRRQAKRDDAYAYSAIAITEPPAYLHAFAAGLYANRPIKRHRDDLPELPKHWKDVINHPFQEGFLAAMRKEINSLTEKATFDTVDRPKDRGKQILPLLWVFAYKFDQDGYLIKLKARICVRGDLETISSDEKRAATLAARTARMIFALVAAFDLNLRQRDAVTAFLNSKLEKDVYTRSPEGFETPGKCWKLRKALYGLRISPRLWQYEASRVLSQLGLQQVPEDPCVFIGDGLIVFFYVDDILIASHPTARERAQKLEKDLEKHWELTDHGEADWFLNIRIIRDRQSKKLWLCQDSYITSIAVRYNLTDRPSVSTPLPIEELEPYDGRASSQDILLYQKKVGSMGYATTITRPDASKATAKLAQFLTNPGPQHHQAADRVISYLYSTRFLAIEYSSTLEIDSVQLASDASYADHKDRRSSAGYICQVYGGPVDWKATKQRTVTTSTTEAELLGLSEAGKHLQWWRRLLSHVGFDASHVITIECDNERAIGLLTNQDASFDTKLRHIDIHHLWLRQEVLAGRIALRWTPTAKMVADGLTKMLSRQQHENFIKLLRMVQIEHLIEGGN
ncbi:uncharacterized protein N7511_009842 [Penicillium nucicola]|uniref:uncharacterized protein n=1 Tax=Penicillium nucicola TaxID=1850975 RepID=UPI002545525B|nr:uncharacterized protein N7511_009842 [Penicillium nucicola]KAJ5748146.1 hypothetical protein N7511_009842 [Penicillium nucicola]